MTVDEILATGRYTDRRGREWLHDLDFDIWVVSVQTYHNVTSIEGIIDTAQMRLWIDRDQHECDGLGYLPDCTNHPVPIVIVGYEHFEWGDFLVRFRGLSRTYRTHAEALAAARALAVGE